MVGGTQKITNNIDRNVEDDDQSEHQKLVDNDDENGKSIRNRILKKVSLIRCRFPVLPIRYEIAIFTSIGFLISFGLRCNMGVSIVAMTLNQTQIDSNGTIQIIKLAQFNWSPQIIGLIESSFFWGYLVTQIPGGYLAARYPANHVFGFALGISAFLNLFIPSAAKTHYGIVIFIRIVQGLFEGVTYPAAHGIWRYWAPPLERSTLVTITYTGSYAGLVVGIPLSGVLTRYFDWAIAFYVFGCVGIVWSLYWWYISYERPEIHPKITQNERIYIQESIGDTGPIHDKTWINLPWSSFFTSMPVWSIIVANFCRSWSFYLLVDSQAKYFLEALHYNVGKNPFLAALPHLVMTCVVPCAGKLADYLRANYLSTTIVRKIMNCGGFGMEAIFLLVVAYAQNSILAITALTIAVGFSGFAIAGYNVNHLDIAPHYASILMGISNGIGTLASIINPIVVELIATNGNRYEWSKIFLITSLIHFFGVIFYGIFASGEKQPWADPPNHTYVSQ